MLTNRRKGIILAGGTGSRLHPVTKVFSKQLLPVYDKPMIYYPLSTLMLADIKNILIITTPEDQGLFKSLLGDGSQWGISLEFKVQPNPNGIAEAFIISEDFIGDDLSALILGDNIFYGNSIDISLKRASSFDGGATIFAYHVTDPERYGVVEFDDNDNVVNIVEKPISPISNYAVTGLYFYDNSAVDYVKKLKPSKRGELEITDLNKIYMAEGKLSVEFLGRGHAWLDTGTHESLLEASQFISTIELRQGQKIACLEEIAFNKKWINKNDLLNLAKPLLKNSYGEYLIQLAKNVRN